jgi:hypothetical protein
VRLLGLGQAVEISSFFRRQENDFQQPCANNKDQHDTTPGLDVLSSAHFLDDGFPSLNKIGTHNANLASVVGVQGEFPFGLPFLQTQLPFTYF